MKTKQNYFKMTIGLYLNYFVHGMGVLLLSQNAGPLAEQFGSNEAGVLYVASALGIGRLFVPIAGIFSDKFGRKPTIIVGIVAYIAFFAGILMSPNVTIAYIFALCAGIANAILDTGTYPALMEAYPESAGSSGALVKTVISVGQFLLPFLVNFVTDSNLYYGIPFLICIGIMFVNLVLIVSSKFPSTQVKAVDAEEKIEEAAEPAKTKFNQKPKLAIDGLPLILIGFTSTATFLLVANGMPTFAQDVVGMSVGASKLLVSYYAMAALFGSLATSVIVKSWVKPVTLLALYPFIAAVFLFICYLNPTALMCTITSIIIGFFAAGGVLQLAITTMGELFPAGKGSATAMIGFVSSGGSFAGPAILGLLMDSGNVQSIMLVNGIITVVGVALAIFVNIRYRQLTSNTGQTKSVGAEA